MQQFAKTQKPLFSRMLAFWAVASLLVWGLVVFGALKQIGQPFAGFRYGVVLRVSPWNQPDWNGPKHGLTTHDRLLTANGEPLDSANELRRIIQSHPPGTPIDYTYRRLQTEHAVTVETQRFTGGDFIQSFLPPLAIGGIFLLIGIVTFLVRPLHPAAQALLMMTSALGLFLTLGVDNDTYRWFNNALFSGFSLACFWLGSSFVHLAVTFPQPGRLFQRAPYLPLTVYVLALGIVLNQGWSDASVPRHITFALWTVLGVVWLLGSLVWSWRKAQAPLARAQALSVLAGAVVAFLPACLTYALPVLFGLGGSLSTFLLRVATLSTLIFPLSIAYAIVRHHLFDIELVFKRTVAYTVVTWLLTGLYFGITAGMRALLGEHSLPGNMLATAAVALLFAPVRDRTKLVVDRLFFRSTYDFQALVTAFGDQAREILDARQLLELFTSQVSAALQPENLAILLCPEGTSELVLSHSLGIAEEVRLVIPLEHPLIQHATSMRKGVFGSGEDVAPLKDVYAWPLLSKDGLFGCVLIGPRKSGLSYQESDHRLLAALTQQLALCFKNAQLFGELSRYASELEDLLRLYEQANELAMTDALTNLYNRRAFQRHLLPSLAEAQRYGRPLSVILFDIDHFKRFNDSYGHAVGDEAIQLVAKTLRATLRLADIPARWGGEEFVVALPETDLEEALIVAERIRANVEQERLSEREGVSIPPVTVSLGVAQCQADDTLDSLIERADRALYVAKSKGRNQAHSLDLPLRGSEATTST